MKQTITKWAIVGILVSLIVYSGFVTYEWREEKKIEEVTLNHAVSLADVPLWELADAGSVLEHLIGYNSTDELLREKVTEYFFHARTLSYSSAILYASTNDEKFRLFDMTMRSLEDFFISVNNQPNSREVLGNNLSVLKQMGYALNGPIRIVDLTLADAERLFELCQELESQQN